MGNQLRDETGSKYGKLFVLGRTSSKHSMSQWLCQCDCGRLVVVRGYHLRSGKTKSCGCFRSEFKKLNGYQVTFNDLFSTYKANSKRRNIIWELTKTQFADLVSGSCVYCNVPPRQVWKGKKGNDDFVYNGLDRVDNTLGYALPNVVPCCWNCNNAKRQMTQEEFADFITKIYHNWAVKEKGYGCSNARDDFRSDRGQYDGSDSHAEK